MSDNFSERLKTIRFKVALSTYMLSKHDFHVVKVTG